VLTAVNQPLLNALHPDDVDVVIQRVDEAEVDEMWSFVGHKGNPRWLWHAIDHHTGKVLWPAARPSVFAAQRAARTVWH
jgi:insertion element IS1 protein InsB